MEMGKCIGVWGEVREVCWGCGKCVGVTKVWGGVGNGGRCVQSVFCGEMCLGCGERCGKGFGVSKWGVRGSVGRNMGHLT